MRKASTLLVALLFALGASASACGGNKDEEKAAARPAAAKEKKKPSSEKGDKKTRNAEKAAKEEKPEVSTGAPVPKELAGVWIKADFPERGQRIEFAPERGMGAILVVKEPETGPDALAYYTQQSRSGPEKGQAMLDCAVKIWAPGRTKYQDVVPDGKGWKGLELIPAIMKNICHALKTYAAQVRFELAEDGSLVVKSDDGARTTVWVRAEQKR